MGVPRHLFKTHAGRVNAAEQQRSTRASFAKLQPAGSGSPQGYEAQMGQADPTEEQNTEAASQALHCPDKTAPSIAATTPHPQGHASMVTSHQRLTS